MRRFIAIVTIAVFSWTSGYSFTSAAQSVQNFEVVVTVRNGKVSARQVAATDFSSALAIARQDPDVVIAEPNQTYQAVALPNDPDFSQQWALDTIGAPTAWDTRTDGSTIPVAVLDSGVDITNPDLVDNIWTNPKEIAGNGVDDDANGLVDDVHGWNFIEKNNNPRPQLTEGATVAGIHHGTVIAGILGARGNNAIAGTGVAWSEKIIPVRVLDSTGSGSTVTVAEGIRYAVAAGAKVINLSFVGTGVSPSLASAITSARQAGVIIVAAAGNENLNLDVTPQYPACYDGVIGVASVNPQGAKSSFSNYGSCVDISAPGENIYSTLYYNPSSGYPDVSGVGWYGTSVASPFVTGAISLLWSQSPNLTVDQVESVLKVQAVNITAANKNFPNALGAGELSLESLLTAGESVERLQVNLLVIPRAGDGPRVREYNASGTLLQQFFTGNSKVQQGAYVTSGDLDGNGSTEIITSLQKKTEPRVRVYSRKGIERASFLAYDVKFRGGVSLAVGDVNGDGKDEIVTVPEQGSAHVRIFNAVGGLLGQFFAFDAKYKSGTHIAIGDVNADGQDEIILGQASKGTRVNIYSAAGKLSRSFSSFPLKMTNGISIAVGDVTGDGKGDIVVGLAIGSPRVRILNEQGKLLREFYAFDKGHTGGVDVAVGDVAGDGRPDIITGEGVGYKPEVRVYKNDGRQRIARFFAFRETSKTGVHVGVIQTHQ